MAEAFNERNLACFGTAIVGTTAQRTNIWVYKADEVIATIKDAGYFAAMVGRGLLGEGDIIVIHASVGGPYLGQITDADSAASIAVGVVDLDLTS